MKVESVLECLQDMYAGFLAHDQVQFDRHLSTEVTTWETHLPRLMNRLELDSYRDLRPHGKRPVLADLQIQDPHIDVWDKHAIARYELVSFPEDKDEAVEVRRVTDVLLNNKGNWVIVHHHAELWKVGQDA